MAKVMDETLAASLEALEKGDSIESILSRYPALATALRPFLETAVSLSTQATNPTLAAKSVSLVAMKKEAATLRPQKPGFLAQFFHRARKFAPAMAVVALLFLLFMTMNASPTSPLYGARQVLDGWRGDPQENEGVIEVEVVETAVSPTITITATNTITATATTAPTETSTPTPEATATLVPSATPAPTSTIAPTETAVNDDDEPDEPDDSESDDSESDDDESDDSESDDSESDDSESDDSESDDSESDDSESTDD